MNTQYPITTVKSQDGAYLVSFVDFPGVELVASSVSQAMASARMTLTSVLTAMMRENLPLPKASSVQVGGLSVALSDDAIDKCLLYEAMNASGIDRNRLATRLDCPAAAVDGLLDLRYTSDFGFLVAAFRAASPHRSPRTRNPPTYGVESRDMGMQLAAFAGGIAQFGVATSPETAVRKTRQESLAVGNGA